MVIFKCLKSGLIVNNRALWRLYVCVKFLYLFLLSSENRLQDRAKILGNILVLSVLVNLQPSLSFVGEGNGNQLQCSCLENPRDRAAWWAAVYGVAQSRTQLKRLSSSSSNISYINSLYGYSLLYPDAKLESKGWLSLFMYILDC